MSSPAPDGTLFRRVATIVLAGLVLVSLTSTAAESAPADVAVITDFPLFASYQPNDQFYHDQWGLRQIDAPLAWDVTLGNRSVVVAVVDTGVVWTHTDLRGNMWDNPVDGTHGYDFIDQDTNPTETDPSGVYHGTGVAGVIAAITDNGQWIAGAVQVSVMALRALGSSGQGSSLNTSQAIRWAADRGARVINLSLGTNETFGGPTDIQLAIDYAWSRGALIVAAAGNHDCGAPYTPGLDYPARLPNVVSVAAIAENGLRACFSHYGPGLDLSAPGDRILTLTDSNNIHYLRGTSFAAPFVSAAAAMLWSLDATLTNREVWNILNGTAISPTGGYSTEYGWGVVNLWNAINALNQPFISVNAYPTSASRTSTFSVQWSILGPVGQTVSDTHVRWGTVSGRLTNATVSQSGRTRDTFTATGLSIPSGADSLFFHVIANVNGTTFVSREYVVVASPLPDFLFVLYQLLASNILYLALFILVLAGIVAFIPQRRARARRAVYRMRTAYPPGYTIRAPPPQPPPTPPPVAPSAFRDERQPTTVPRPTSGAPPQTRPPAPPPRPPAAPSKVPCPSCGTLVNPDNLFCFFCGNRIR